MNILAHIINKIRLRIAGWKKVEESTTDENIELTETDVKLFKLLNNFNFHLFEQLIKQDGGNIFVSPMSVMIGLAMLYNGAEGTTQEAIAKVLGLKKISPERINKIYRILLNRLRDLNTLDTDIVIAIANSLWAKDTVKFKSKFLKAIADIYHATISNVDFDDPTIASIINAWVVENTRGKIDQIIQSPIDKRMVAILLNAIYFKGKWSEPFDNVKEGHFTLSDGRLKLVHLMFQWEDRDYYYYKDDSFEAIRLYYGNKDNLSMVIFLPAKGTRVEQFSFATTWKKWQLNRELLTGSIVLPRFKTEYEVTLNEVLETLGMGIAFKEEEANFRKMATIPKGRNFYLSTVKHKTFVEVNEVGTEAAAVTAFEEVEWLGLDDEETPFRMVVNRPFWFVIEEYTTGTILFMGTIVEPQE